MAFISLQQMYDTWKRVSDWVSGVTADKPNFRLMESVLSSVVTMQNAATATGNGTSLPTNGMGVALLAVSGTFNATIIFEGQGPDGNWYAVNAVNRGTGAISTSATSPGLYEINVRGLTAIRARISAYTSGSVTVKGQAQPLSLSNEFLQLTGSNVPDSQRIPVKILNNGGVEPSISSISADSILVGNGISTVSVPYAFNGTNYDRWRNNMEGTLFANAARTGVVISSDQINYNARGVLLTLTVTANPGGTETLNFYIQISDPYDNSGAYGQFASLTTKAAVNERYRLLVYPGATSTPDLPTNNKAVSLSIPRRWKAVVSPSGSGSWTYSLTYQYIL